MCEAGAHQAEAHAGHDGLEVGVFEGAVVGIGMLAGAIRGLEDLHGERVGGKMWLGLG